jgi:hypothetical protein
MPLLGTGMTAFGSKGTRTAVGKRLSYSTFRAVFLTAWLLVGAGVICAAARAGVGFVLFVCAGVLLSCLGASLALNSGQLSDRMVDEVMRRSDSAGSSLSMSRFGGTLLFVIGAGLVVFGVIALS